MDLQTRKLDLIAYFAQLQDESFVTKIENYILSKQPEDFKVLTVEELLKRIEKSEMDFRNGNFKTQEELEIESSNW